MSSKYPVLVVFLMALLAATATAQNKRDTAVRSDKQRLSADETWIYDDLDLAIDEAKATKRPLMVVFR